MSKRAVTFSETSRATKYRIWKVMNETSSSDSEDNIDIPFDEDEMEVEEGFNRAECNARIGDINDTDVTNVGEQQQDEAVHENESIPSLNESSNTSAESTESEAESEVDDDENDEDDDNDDDEDDDEDEYGVDEENEPLYPGAPLSLGESVVSILIFALRHKLTGTCLADLLTLIYIHCSKPNQCLKSLYRFKKYFKLVSTPLIRHFYCSGCFSKLLSPDSKCIRCTGSKGTSYFIEIPLLAQLASLFKRQGFYTSLGHRYTRQKMVRTNYEDIYDGAVYKKLSDSGFLSCRSNISLTWNTDGVRLFKSSKFNIWPFYFQMNELPFHHRTKKENLLVGGIWFGPNKPQPNLFMEIFREPLRALYTGVNFEITDMNTTVKVRGILMCGTCDLPAKALFLNMKQYNGTFGCQKCKITSKKVDTVRVYPYQHQLSLRTTDETIAYAREAFRKSQAVKGVKGPTLLSQISYDFITSTAIDIMHCVFLGVAKKLMALWFDPTFGTAISSLHRFIKIIDERIHKIFPPAIVNRLPRYISDFHYWKAHEIKTWLLIYSLPILSDIMQTRYFEHHQLLVHGITLLSQKSVSESMIDIASRALNEYVSRFEDLYGRRHMTCNLHLLLHLPEVVKNFGPLWTTSCFPFEDANGLLKSLVHGTRYAQLQIHSAISMFLNLADIKYRVLIPNGDVSNYVERLEQSSRRRRKVHRVFEKTFVVGMYKRLACLPDSIREAFLEHDINLGHHYYSFECLYKDGVMYESCNQKRSKKTNSSFVKFESRGEDAFGQIEAFVRVSQYDCNEFCSNCGSEFYIILTRCQTANPFTCDLLPVVQLSSVYSCSLSNNEPMIVIDLNKLETICFYINCGGVEYIVEPANTLEFE